MDVLSRDLEVFVAVVILIAGVGGALILRGLVVKLIVLAIAVLIAAYVAGLLPPLPL
jgi:hypothetical protein